MGTPRRSVKYKGAIWNWALGLIVSADPAKFASIEVFGSVEGFNRLISIPVIRVVLPSITSSEMFWDEPRNIFGDGWT